MRDITSNNFGLLIAYVLPGFTILWESRLVSPTVESWLAASTENAPTVAGFLYATMGSVAIGLTVSTVRWLLIDSIHHHTGIHRAEWDFSQLPSKLPAFETLIEIHYRYYQFCSGMLIALPIAAAIRWAAMGFRWGELIVVTVLAALFFIGSRDTLAKYYRRGEGVLKRV